MTDPLCPKCGHPASHHRVEGSSAVCHSWATGHYAECSASCSMLVTDIYRHALTEMRTELERVRGLCDDMADELVPLLLHAKSGESCRDTAERLIAERDALRAENAKLREALERTNTVLTFEKMLDSKYPEQNLASDASRQPDPAPGGTENDR